MVRRAEVTPELVNRTQPPDHGEIRIADTKCDGFGLRVWRTAGGVGRAFDLRAKDASGRSTRRTYKPRYGSPNLTFTRLDHLRGTFGFYLEDAREWAEDERYKIAGLPTPEEVAWAKRCLLRETAEGQSFLAYAESFLDKGRSNGWSEAYCDGIAELVHLLPREVLDAPLGRLEPDRFIDGLVGMPTPMHRIDKLREFVSKMVNSETGADAGWQLSARETSHLYAKAFRQRRGPALIAEFEAAKEFLPGVLHALESEDELRFQATALRLYFATGCKQAPLLRARWAMIIDDIWYPYFPNEQASWYLARERLDEDARGLLERHRARVLEQFPDSQFIFPSATFAGKRPIQSFDRCWRKALKGAGWNLARDGAPRLRNFAMVARNRTSPAAIASSSFYRTNGPYTEDANVRGRVCRQLKRLNRSA